MPKKSRRARQNAVKGRDGRGASAAEAELAVKAVGEWRSDSGKPPRYSHGNGKIREQKS